MLGAQSKESGGKRVMDEPLSHPLVLIALHNHAVSNCRRHRRAITFYRWVTAVCVSVVAHLPLGIMLFAEK